MAQTTPTTLETPELRAVRILAKSTYKELRASGRSRSEIVAFTSELLELVAADVKNRAGQLPANV